VGIGFACASTFAAHGAEVAVVDRDAAATGRACDAIAAAGGGLATLAAPAEATAMGTPKPVVNEHRDIGRNDPCWCGSGKKYKRCHGA